MKYKLLFTTLLFASLFSCGTNSDNKQTGVASGKMQNKMVNQEDERDEQILDNGNIHKNLEQLMIDQHISPMDEKVYLKRAKLLLKNSWVKLSPIQKDLFDSLAINYYYERGEGESVDTQTISFELSNEDVKMVISDALSSDFSVIKKLVIDENKYVITGDQEDRAITFSINNFGQLEGDRLFASTDSLYLYLQAVSGTTNPANDMEYNISSFKRILTTEKTAFYDDMGRYIGTIPMGKEIVEVQEGGKIYQFGNWVNYIYLLNSGEWFTSISGWVNTKNKSEISSVANDLAYQAFTRSYLGEDATPLSKSIIRQFFPNIADKLYDPVADKKLKPLNENYEAFTFFSVGSYYLAVFNKKTHQLMDVQLLAQDGFGGNENYINYGDNFIFTITVYEEEEDYSMIVIGEDGKIYKKNVQNITNLSVAEVNSTLKNYKENLEGWNMVIVKEAGIKKLLIIEGGTGHVDECIIEFNFEDDDFKLVKETTPLELAASLSSDNTTVKINLVERE